MCFFVSLIALRANAEMLELLKDSNMNKFTAAFKKENAERNEEQK